MLVWAVGTIVFGIGPHPRCCRGAAPRSSPQSSAPQPHWIWATADRSPGQVATLQRSFKIPRPLTSATLTVLAESAAIAVTLDQEEVLEAEPYAGLQTRDLTSQLSPGEHVLTLRGRSVPGPAACFAWLQWTCADGSQGVVVSDRHWTAALEAPRSAAPGAGAAARAAQAVRQPTFAASFGAVDPRLTIPRGWRIGIDATENYEQWKQALDSEDRQDSENPAADSASYRVHPEFRIQRVRSARPGEDSWVSLAFDPRGRVVIAKEQQGLLRMTLSDDGARVVHSETINDSLKECRGLLFAKGSLFANANNSKGLYRLDPDARDQFPEARLLYASSGGVGHGRNDLALGPDGKLYSIHGDSVDLPQQPERDHTSPLRAARRGRDLREGHVLRMDLDGKHPELLVAGLRNPFGIDFNADGEMFTYDADAEFDMGSPWYRPTRVQHLVLGGDFGWRGVTGAWPPYYPDHPDNAPPTFTVGKGSPTAVKFGTRSNFPPRYREALFALDWAYGRILAIHLLPVGASYTGSAETFLQGRPLNVTDLDFGPDGALYFVTGGRKTQSALYRVSHVPAAGTGTGNAGDDAAGNAVGDAVGDTVGETAQQRARQAFARRGRQLRRQLERLVSEPAAKPPLDAIWEHLADADPSLRYAARNALEHMPRDQWQARALAPPGAAGAGGGAAGKEPRGARLAALMALARSCCREAAELAGSAEPPQPLDDQAPALAATIVDRLNQTLNRVPLIQLPGWQQRMVLQCYWLCLQHPLPAGTRRDALAALDAAYPAGSRGSDIPLSRVLAALGAPDLPARTMTLWQQAERQEDQLHYLFVLRDVREGWTAALRRRYFAALAGTRDYVRGAGMEGFVQQIRDAAVAALDAEQRRQLADVLAPPPAEELAGPTPPRPVVKQWQLADLAELLQPAPKHSAARGAEVFRQAGCARCHQVSGRGGALGPDLSGVANRFSRRDILQSILQPSLVVAENYRSLQIVTRGGKTLVGRVLPGGDYRSPILKLAVDPEHPGRVVEIPKQEILQQQFSPLSWMPQGLLDSFHIDEIGDLLAYLQGRGQEPDTP